MKNKILALFISVLIILSVIPLSVFAAPASDIPAEMLDNAFLDALAYTGYDVQAQKDDGSIYKKYTGSVAASIRSNISYGTGPAGTETISKSGTVTGLAPDIAKFEANGLCCASYVSYVYFNYLPNIAGIDTSGITKPTNYRLAEAYDTLANSWVSAGTGRRISFSQSGSTFTPSESIPIGSLVSFKNSSGDIKHVAIYAGAYDGKHFITHVGNERGPEFCTIEGMTKGGTPQTVNQIVVPNFVNPTGSIEVNKKDTEGNALSGAYFVATLTTDSTKQYLIGPTNSSGYAKTSGPVPYGTYTVKETVFPTNYRAYGQTEWTVTVGASNNGKAAFSAVNELIPGIIKIVKSSEDGKVSGFGFNISGNGVNKNVTTNSNGEITVNDLKPGSYTVTEAEYDTYIPQSPQKITVVSGKTTTVYFNNKLRRGDLTIIKTAEDGFVDGLQFGLSGTSLSGEKVDMFAVSDNSGKAYFNDIPIGEYRLFEYQTPDRYVEPAEIDVTIKWNETTEIGMHNALKKWRADIYKVDSEYKPNEPEEKNVMLLATDFETTGDLHDYYGYAQGDASLEGAVYGLYKGGVLIDTYTTDKSGYFLTNYYPCGYDYYIKEITPSTGYLLDETVYYIDAYEEWYTAEYNTIYLDCYETVIKSNMMLIKHSDDGSTQIETPEVGAEFEIYLKSSGSYEKAKDTEKDFLTINKHGIAISKELPYGTYTVKQVNGKEGFAFMPAFDVVITEHAEVYSYIINNAPFEALIDIVKKDATTNKTIPAAGVGFKVKDLQTNEFIVQHINYPTPMDIDVFYTDTNGKLRLPEKLGYGEYELIEQCTANGYVLDATPVKFTVDGSKDIVTVEKLNNPQMGTITITKEGEVFSTVNEQDGIYTPVFEKQGLEGAEFSVYAAQDIYTLDGTLRNPKGDKVDTIVTGKDGTATTKPLFLGKYEIREDKAPHGMVLTKESIFTELVYAGQEVEITTTAETINNERQKVVISLLKELEKDEAFNIGFADEYMGVKFGLFADETLIAADGTEIPKDGLLEIISIDEDGNGIFSVDVPVGAKLYVKEIETNEQYVLSDEKYPVVFDYVGQDIATVQLLVNDGNVISNKIIRGRIEGNKTDPDGNAIENAVFGLFKSDETEFTEEKALAIVKSDETGAFVFSGIPFGKWVIKELSCPEEYVMSEQLYEISITEDGEILSLGVVNKRVSGAVKVTKVNKANSEQKLSGAEFELYKDKDGNGSFDPNIDTLIGKLTETETGIYTLDGLEYGGYFLHESKAPDKFQKDDRYFYFEIKEDGKAVVIENEKGVGFVNEPVSEDVPTSPKTGDNSNILGFIILAAVSLLLMIICSIGLRKKTNKA